MLLKYICEALAHYVNSMTDHSTGVCNKVGNGFCVAFHMIADYINKMTDHSAGVCSKMGNCFCVGFHGCNANCAVTQLVILSARF